MDKIYLLIGNDTPLAVCLRKSEGEETPVPYDLSEARHLRLALVGHGMRVCAKDIEVSGDDDNVVSGMIPGRSLLKGDYDLEVTFTIDGRDKRFAIDNLFEAVDFLAEDADGEAEGEGAGIYVTVTVQPEVIEIAGPTGPKGDTPVLTADEDGTIYADGVLLTEVVKDVTEAVESAERSRVTAESQRVAAESARVSAETARESQAASDHTRAESDHTTAASDHTRAESDHTNSETATNAANTAAAHAEEAAATIDDKIAGKADESEVSQLRSEMVRSKVVLGINLFNKDSDNLFNGYCGGNGYSSNNSYRMTHPIYVTGGVSYTCPGQGNLGATQRVAYCTVEGTFVSSFQVSLVDGYVTFTPENSGYIRVNIGAANKVDAFMFCKTSEYPDSYTPYSEKLVVGDAYGLGVQEKTDVSEILYNEVKDSLPWQKLNANEGFPASNGLYYSDGTHKVIYLGGRREKLTIKANSSKDTYFLVLKTYTKPTQFGSASMVPDYATGESGRHVVTSGTEVVSPLPFDARYIVIGYTHGDDDMSPVMITADGIDFYNDARIALGPVAETQSNVLKENLLPLYCPAPQAPANDTAGSDFNAETLTAGQLQAAFDSLVEALPRYSSLYGIGKDCTGNNDLKAYVFTRRNRYAFKAADALFAWKDQSNNVVYIDSVSPMVGASIYSNTSRAIAGTVASYGYVDGIATMSDGNGVTYTKESTFNVPADVVFSKSLSDIGAGFSAYDSSDASVGSATSSDGIHYTLGGKTYTRFAGFDYHTDVHFTLVLVGNVHGPQSDPMEPSVILYRMAKDLCTGAGIKTNRFLNYLKQNARIVMFPAANPSGILKWVENGVNGRNNANGVNINRNYDTPGWAVYSGTDKGAYPGDQPETQYIMNLLSVFNPLAAYDVHCYGYAGAAGSSTDAASAFGLFPSVEGREQYTAQNWDDFNIKTWQFGYGDPATGCQMGSYLKQMGIHGSTIEMWAGESTATITDYYNGHQHTSLVMEYCYSMLLNSIKSVWSVVDPDKDFTLLGIK